MFNTISHAQVREGFACAISDFLPPAAIFIPLLLAAVSVRALAIHTSFPPRIPLSLRLSLPNAISLLWDSSSHSIICVCLCENVLALGFVPSDYLSFPPVPLAQYLYAALLCNTSLIHTPPLPLFLLPPPFQEPHNKCEEEGTG